MKVRFEENLVNKFTISSIFISKQHNQKVLLHSRKKVPKDCFLLRVGLVSSTNVIYSVTVALACVWHFSYQIILFAVTTYFTENVAFNMVPLTCALFLFLFNRTSSLSILLNILWRSNLVSRILNSLCTIHIR